MDTSVQTPQCFTLFDPIASECAMCAIQGDCIKEQASKVMPETKTQPESISTEATKPKRKESESTQPHNYSSDEQFIPQHTRKPLEIPPVGSTIQATHKGQTYEALIVEDPSNKRSDGRSILFNGTVYRTLTAAAHAISPGINSGSVWQQIQP